MKASDFPRIPPDWEHLPASAAERRLFDLILKACQRRSSLRFQFAAEFLNGLAVVYEPKDVGE
jgi:hypothetical protein